MAIAQVSSKSRNSHPGFAWPADHKKDITHVCVWQCKRCGKTTPTKSRTYALNELWMQHHAEYDCPSEPKKKE